MNWIRARGRRVVVAWEGADLDERGRQLVPGSTIGLVYGREVHFPVARVVDVGEVGGLAAGDRVIATKDPVELVRLDGGLEVQVIAIEERSERTGQFQPTDEIVAVLVEGEPKAFGRRIVGVPVTVLASELLDVAEYDGERLRVTSVGADVDHIDVQPGNVVLVRDGADRRIAWSDRGQTFVSVPDCEVLGVEVHEYRAALDTPPLPRRRVGVGAEPSPKNDPENGFSGVNGRRE